MWHHSEQKTHQVFDPYHYCGQRLQKTSPRKTASRLVSESQTESAFYWCWLCEAKNISLWLSTMHGGSGSQSQHSIHMILKSRGSIFRFTGGNWGNHVKKNTEISTLWCVPTGLFWLCNAGMLYELTHWSGLRKSKPSLGQYRWISVWKGLVSELVTKEQIYFKYWLVWSPTGPDSLEG